MRPVPAGPEGHMEAVPVLGALSALVVASEVLGRLGLSLFLPAFSSVAAVWWQVLVTGPLLPALLKSLESYVKGMVPAVAAGVVAGLLLGRYRWLGEVFDPFLNMMMSAPLAGFIPILMAIFGISDTVVVLTVFLFSFFIILVNTRTGLQGTPRSLVEMARSLGATDVQILTRIYFFAALPAMMVGVRLGAVNGVKGLVVGEMLIALVGMGELLIRYGNTFLINHLYAVILTILGLALTVSLAIQALDRLAIRWK